MAGSLIRAMPTSCDMKVPFKILVSLSERRKVEPCIYPLISEPVHRGACRMALDCSECQWFWALGGTLQDNEQDVSILHPQ